MHVVAEILQAVVTSLGIILGGAWAIWRFFLRAEAARKVQVEIADLCVVDRDKALKGAVTFRIQNPSNRTIVIEGFYYSVLPFDKFAQIARAEAEASLGDFELSPNMAFEPQVWSPGDIADNVFPFCVTPADTTAVVVNVSVKVRDVESRQGVQRVFVVDQQEDGKRRPSAQLVNQRSSEKTEGLSAAVSLLARLFGR